MTTAQPYNLTSVHLAIRLKLFGEEHKSTADSYRELGVIQNNMHDYSAALQSHQHALAIRLKLFGEDHESTADSCRQLGVIQNEMHDYSAALQSHQHALASVLNYLERNMEALLTVTGNSV